MLILLVRHGATVLNEQKRYQGSTDTPLSEKGRSALKRSDLCPEEVFVSPMIRASQTAEILFPGVEQSPVWDLREMDFGAFEGRGYWEMEEDAEYRAWVEGGCVGRCPGGEDRKEFSDRTCGAFDRLVRKSIETGKQLIAVVAHGGTQMVVMERYGRPERPYYRWQTGIGAGYLLDTSLWPEELRILKEVHFTKETP